LPSRVQTTSLFKRPNSTLPREAVFEQRAASLCRCLEQAGAKWTQLHSAQPTPDTRQAAFQLQRLWQAASSLQRRFAENRAAMARDMLRSITQRQTEDCDG